MEPSCQLWPACNKSPKTTFYTQGNAGHQLILKGSEHCLHVHVDLLALEWLKRYERLKSGALVRYVAVAASPFAPPAQTGGTRLSLTPSVPMNGQARQRVRTKDSTGPSATPTHATTSLQNG